MAVCCTAIFAFLFYLAAVPIKIALVICISTHSGFGAGAAPFEGRFALRRARQRALGERKHWPWQKTESDLLRACALPAAWQTGKYLFRRTHLEVLHLQGKIAGDAARSALICSCASALEGSLAPLAGRRRIQLRLQPDFSSNESELHLCGMISIRLGHIICAALIGAWHYIARRIRHGKASD